MTRLRIYSQIKPIAPGSSFRQEAIFDRISLVIIKIQYITHKNLILKIISSNQGLYFGVCSFAQCTMRLVRNSDHNDC